MIKHIKCDIFESGADIICHQVNCQGVMGSGVAKQVRERYPWVYAHYKRLCNTYKNHKERMLGFAQSTFIDENTEIVNLYAQLSYGYDGACYTDYYALKQGLKHLSVTNHKKTIAIPYLMGCHRGGGDWNIVYKIIEEVFADSDCEVLICEYNGG